MLHLCSEVLFRINAAKHCNILMNEFSKKKIWSLPGESLQAQGHLDRSCASLCKLCSSFGGHLQFLEAEILEVHAAGKASCCLLHLKIFLPLWKGCRANCNNSGKITLGVEFKQLQQEVITVRDECPLGIDGLQIQPHNILRTLANMCLYNDRKRWWEHRWNRLFHCSPLIVFQLKFLCHFI